jgi:hypothetical protein
MIIGEVCVNPRDVINAWYRFEPGACAYCVTIRLQGDDDYTDREQWTTKREEVDKYLKLAEKCIVAGNVWRDEMARIDYDANGGED